MTNTDSTLDADRLDRLRTFLVVEAASDLAASRAPRRRHAGATVGRLAAGGLAVAVAVAALVAHDASDTSPARQADAAAVTITEQSGWTTIGLRDPDASATDVIAELEAAGIDARALPEGADPWGSAPLEGGMVGIATDAGLEVQRGGTVDVGTITQINVEYTEPAGVTSPDAGQADGADVAPTPESAADRAAYMDAIGVRTNADAGTVSIRQAGDHEVLLFVAS
jgi:hypothetical protein